MDHGTEPLAEDVCGIHLRGLRLLRGRRGIDWVPAARGVVHGLGKLTSRGFSRRMLCLTREKGWRRAWF